MKTFAVAVIATACAGSLLACSSKDDKKADNKTKPAKTKTAKTTPAKTKPTPTPKPVPQKPTCVRVLATQPITDGAGAMKATLNKDELDTKFDAAAEYRKNPVWEGLDTPPACGLVTSDDKLNLVAFFKESGQPSLQLRLIGATGGVHKLDGKTRVIGGMVTSNDLHYALFFKKGKLTVTPKKLAPGKITITIENGEGVAMRKGMKASFTLSGKFSGTVAKRRMAPKKKTPAKTPPSPGKATK